MPPNRKANAAAALAVPDIAGFVKESAFPTLTAPIAPTAVTAKPLPQKTSSVAESDEYWTWHTKSEKEILTERILEEERIRQLFSVKHLTQKLQEAAIKQPSTSAPKDDYWSMPTEAMPEEEARHLTSADRIVSNLVQHSSSAFHSCAANLPYSSYWDWSQDGLEEQERSHRLVQASHIEQRLVAAGARLTTGGAANPDHDSYWAF